MDRGFIGHKSAKMMKRAKVVEARQQRALREKEGLLKNLETAQNLKLFPLEYRTDTLVSFADAAPIYDGNQVCAPVTFSIQQGDRIALEGRNGSGKSSLLKLLTDDTLAHSGRVTVGSGLVISVVAQDSSSLSGTLTEFAEKYGLEESLFKAVLRQMDFERVQFDKRMEDFSEGQKKKVLLARSLCERAHLYVWDEPLNYIDIYTRMQIEQLILEYSPTMLFVEHDRMFRDRIATRTVEVGDI